MPKGNPNPIQTDEFKAHQLLRADGTTEPLAEKQLQIRVGATVDAAIRALPNKTAWLRRVITEAAIAEGLVKE